MDTFVIRQLIPFVAVIGQSGIPVLRVAFSVAVLVFLYGGFLIFRKRHKLFDRDPTVENDVAEVRHDRMQMILFIWGALTLVLIGILVQVWSN